MMVRTQSSAAFQRGRTFSVIVGGLSDEQLTSQRLEVPKHCSVWLTELMDRFEELTSLERGWDGYSGRPVSFVCATFAANLLETICVDTVPAPSLVPGSDGTLQIEWHLNGYDVEVDVLGANNVIATRYSYDRDEDETVELKNDFSELVDWIDDLDRANNQGQAAIA